MPSRLSILLTLAGGFRRPAALIALLLLGLGFTACQRPGTTPAVPPPTAAPKPLAQVVHYRDFGAVGDGRTDDFDALIAAHRHANQTGLPVRAQDGATYYIGAGNRTAEIRTDTDFGTAAFIIDDRQVTLEHRKAPVFKVASDLPPLTLKNVPAFRKDQRRIEVRLPARSLVVPVDAGTKRYFRRGGNQNAGNPQQDVLLVDADGTLDPAVPPFWDFNAITECTAYPLDAKPLTLRGGRFTTIANQAPSAYTYFARGLQIERSTVTVEGLTHLVTGEGETGAPYAAFINIFRASDVVVRNCVLTTRKKYFTIGAGGTQVGMGSYDLSIHQSVNVSIVGCTQSTDLFDDTRWSVMSSNGSKNLVYDGCVLTRFDAHAGLLNATIRNSTVRHIAVTGWGTLRIENSTIPNSKLITLRDDYGSNWDGEVIIRDCVLAPPAAAKAEPIALITGGNDGQHDFGYPCAMPRRIDIDGLKILDSADAKGAAAAVILRATLGKADAPYPYRLPQEVVTSRLTTASGRPVMLSNSPIGFAGTRWIQK
jgi:hypothetical protein